MKILISSKDQPNRSVMIDSNPLFHDQEMGSFWMTRPRGDDWLQRVTSNFKFPAVAIESRPQEMIISFESIEHAQTFEAWLLYANAEADEGYRKCGGSEAFGVTFVEGGLGLSFARLGRFYSSIS